MSWEIFRKEILFDYLFRMKKILKKLYLAIKLLIKKKLKRKKKKRNFNAGRHNTFPQKQTNRVPFTTRRQTEL